jgi:hypothetical protein
VSRLTFHIDEDAALVGAKRARPWTSLRAKLFGIETDHAAIPAPFAAIEGRSPQSLVRRFSTARMAPQSAPLAGMAQPRPIAAAAPAFPKSSGHRSVYKGRLIVALQLGDGSWTAIHAPLGTDPSAQCELAAQNSHRFMARILAISSAEIEIDDLERRGA